MPVTGPLSHLDISVGYPARSIAFYDALLTALGFRRNRGVTSEFAGANPRRAGWRLETSGALRSQLRFGPPAQRTAIYAMIDTNQVRTTWRSTPKPSKR